jgi:HlyD family secretion protein
MRCACLVIASLLLAAGCSKPQSETSKAIDVVASPTVTVVSPKKQPLAWSVEQPGTVQAFESAPIVAKLSGFVSKVYVDLGDKVTGPTATTPGTLLAEIAIPELDQELKQKAAEVLQRQAEVTLAQRGADVAKEHVNSIQAQLSEAKAMLSRTTADVERWTSEFKRIEGLVSRKVVDTQTLDETRKQLKTASSSREEVDAKILSATALVREAEAHQGQATAEIQAAQAKLKVAEAEVGRVQALLGYTKIHAPMSGVITGRFIHTGHFLQPTGTKPEALFNLAKLDTVRVVADVPDRVIEYAKAGAPATVVFPSLGNREVKATLSRASGALNSESRTLRVEIDLPNPDGLWKPGLYVLVKLSGQSAEVMTVPSGAVLFADETAYMYEVTNGVVSKLRVKVGRVEATQIELLGKRPAGTSQGAWAGITGTERIVVGNLGALADGQAVVEK